MLIVAPMKNVGAPLSISVNVLLDIMRMMMVTAKASCRVLSLLSL